LSKLDNIFNPKPRETSQSFKKSFDQIVLILSVSVIWSQKLHDLANYGLKNWLWQQ